jgi:leucyl-tRNA synthetase
MRNLPRLVLDDRLQAGLEGLDWPARTMTAQKQWIRRSTGTQIVFPVQGSDDEVINIDNAIDKNKMGTEVVFANNSFFLFRV